MLDQADLFILLDTVPVNEKSWQTRNRVINSQGNETWLSIPTHSAQGMLLEDVRIADNGWRRKHKGTLNALAKGRPELEPILALYDEPWDSLVAFTERMLVEIGLALSIRTAIVRASVYGLPRRSNPIDRIADLLERVGADELLDAAGARDVLNVDQIPVGGNPRWVPIRYHEYEPQPYSQGNGAFVSHMSVLDCLARHGPELTLRVIRSGRTPA